MKLHFLTDESCDIPGLVRKIAPPYAADALVHGKAFAPQTPELAKYPRFELVINDAFAECEIRLMTCLLYYLRFILQFDDGLDCIEAVFLLLKELINRDKVLLNLLSKNNMDERISGFYELFTQLAGRDSDAIIANAAARFPLWREAFERIAASHENNYR